MLLNISHNDKEVKRKIDTEVGPPYSLLERIKSKGVGSPKLIITAASATIYNLLQLDQSRNTCNIELRPQGIIIGFQKRLEVYALVIPYYKLNVYKGEAEVYSFYKDHYFVKIEARAKDTAIHKFVTKLLQEKEKQTPTRLEDL